MIQIISFLSYHFSTEKQNKNKRAFNHQLIYSQSYSLSERCHVPDCAEDTLVTGRAAAMSHTKMQAMWTYTILSHFTPLRNTSDKHC